jgi:phosphoglycolate phosphatase-like HAD superfamily hydrolase
VVILARKKIVIFDLDGTLIDSNLIKRSCFLALCENALETGIMIKLLDDPTNTRNDIFEIFAKKLCKTDYQESFLLRTFNSNVRNKLSKSKEIKGASKLMIKLNSMGIKMYLSSLTPSAEITPIIKSHGWTDLFDDIFGSPQDKSETIRLLMDNKQFNAKDIVIIGDGEDDFLSAKRNSIDFIPVGEGRGDHNTKIKTIEEIKIDLCNSI